MITLSLEIKLSNYFYSISNGFYGANGMKSEPPLFLSSIIGFIDTFLSLY